MVKKKEKPVDIKIKLNLFKKVIISFFSKTENIFLVIALPAIAAFIYITPQSWGVDEQYHIARAYQISEGALYPQQLPEENEFGGELPVSLVETINYGWAESNMTRRDLSFYDAARQDITTNSSSKAIGGQKINDSRKQTYNFGPTGPYSPVVYMPAAIGMNIGKALDLSVSKTLKFAKLAQAVFYLSLVYLALRFIGKYKIKWLLLMVSLLPMSIFLVTTINADVYTNAVVILFAAIMYRLFMKETRMNRMEAVLLVATSLALMLTKPSYAAAIILILFLPNMLFVDKKQSYIQKGILFVVCIIFFLVLSLKGLQYSDAILIYFTDETAKNMGLVKQLGFMIHHPFDFVKVMTYTVVGQLGDWVGAMVGVLGYNRIQTPYPLLIVSALGMFVASLYADKIKLRYGLLFLTVGILSAISVIILLYLTFNPVGQSIVIGVQGRYFIPCLIFIAIGLPLLLRMKIVMSDRYAKILFTSIATIVLYGTLYAYVEALF